MFGLQFLLGRRQRADDDVDMNASLSNNNSSKDDKGDAEALKQQPPTKKIKTGHNNNNNDKAEEERRHGEMDPAEATLVREVVFSDHNLLENITAFCNYHEELQLAVCNVQLYVFFASRAANKLVFIYAQADPNQQSAFVRRMYEQAKNALPVHDQSRLVTAQEPTRWQSMWMWLRGERPPRWIKPHRYRLHCAYMVPVDVQAGFLFGPSCSYGDRLYCLAETGAIITMDAEPKPVDCQLTRQSERDFFGIGYDNLFDKLWFCASNNNSNVDKGFLVLEHRPNLVSGSDIRVLDLSQTNQDIGRADSRTGIDHRRITPSGAFHADNGRNIGEVVVSERDGLIFFVGAFDGTLWIESYDMMGQLVASTRKVIEAGSLGSNSLPHTISVITQDKLVIVYHTEDEVNDGVADYGFGIYVLDCHDLSFCGYTPFFSNYAISFSKISKDWLVYRRPGIRSDFALRITGGIVGRPTNLNLGSADDIGITGNLIYTYTSHEEGDIEFDQFDLLTGNKIRTLKTGIPWKFDDDGTAFLPLAGPAVDGSVRRLSRSIVDAHVVGNKVAFLISSQGKAKNTIVAFAFPPPP